MSNTQDVQLDKDLINQLETLANEKQTDINNLIKLILLENEEYKNPSYLTTTKVSKNKSTFSTVIPAPIKNKFNLSKGQVLFWDIGDNQIIITPDITRDDLPETPSLEAGEDILKDMLFNGNSKYSKVLKDIFTELESNQEDKTIIDNIYLNYDGSNSEEEYKKVITYLLDYPLDITKHTILKEVQNKIYNLD